MTLANPQRASTWLGTAVLASLLAAPAAAQVSYFFDFDANSTGWTGNFSRYTNSTTCSGTGSAMRRNMYSPTNLTGQMISPLTGVSQGGLTDFSFDYKVADWSANTNPTASPWGSFEVQYGPTATGPWTTIATISDEIQTGSCINHLFQFTPPAGDLYVRFASLWVDGDYYLNFDNITLTEAVSPCAGTPAPGDTIVPAGGACSGQSFTLSLQNGTAGSGVDYQWYVSNTGNTGPWTPIGGNSSTLITSQTATSWYYCDVTCTASAATGSSNVGQVDMASTVFPQDFSTGTADPNCWSLEALVGASVPEYNAVSAFGVGTGAVKFNFYQWSTPREVALTSPEFAPVAAGTEIYFDVAGRTYTGGEIDVIELEESNDGGATWTSVATMTNESGVGVLATLPADGASFTPAAGDWASLAYTLSAGTNRVRFHGISDFGNNVYLDNISVGAMPSARHTNYGTGCGSPAMTMSAAPAPIAGTTFLYDLPNVPLACPAPAQVFHFGFVILSFGQDFAGTDLLAGYGIDSPGCKLHVTSLDLLLSYVDSVPGQTVAFDVPLGAPAGVLFYSQAVALICPEAPNNAGIVTSNGVRTYVNNF